MSENEGDVCSYMRNEFDYPAYRISMSTMYSLAALVTTVLNSLVLISIWKTPSLHKPSYILIGSLALSDLLVGVIGEPLMVIYYIGDLRGLWSLNNSCLVFKFSKIVNFALAAISLFTLMFISVDRLLAVKLRNRYQGVVTQKLVFYVLLTDWVAVSVISPTLIGNLGSNSQTYSALLLFDGALVFILVVAITVCYSMAFYTLRKITSSSVSPSVQNAEAVPHTGPSIDVAKYRRSLITMFLVFITTILFYAPFVSISIASFVVRDTMSGFDTILLLMVAAEFFALLNSMMNPLLYLWRNRDIREAVKATIKNSISNCFACFY